VVTHIITDQSGIAFDWLNLTVSLNLTHENYICFTKRVVNV